MSSPKLEVAVRRFDDIAQWMLEGKSADVPDVLAGIFYMDHVRLREECGTFDGMGWDPEKRTVSVPVFAPLQWTYEDSARGRHLLLVHRFIRFTLDFRFADDGLRSARITPVLFGFLRIPWWLIEFDMVRADGDDTGSTWYRSNVAFFRLHSFGGYTLRRVINRDGTPTPAFQRMLEANPATCLTNVVAGSVG